MMDFGLRALVGPSFGEIFQVNCIQNGILAITLPEPTSAISGGNCATSLA